MNEGSSDPWCNDYNNLSDELFPYLLSDSLNVLPDLQDINSLLGNDGKLNERARIDDLSDCNNVSVELVQFVSNDSLKVFPDPQDINSLLGNDGKLNERARIDDLSDCNNVSVELVQFVSNDPQDIESFLGNEDPLNKDVVDQNCINEFNLKYLDDVNSPETVCQIGLQSENISPDELRQQYEQDISSDFVHQTAISIPMISGSIEVNKDGSLTIFCYGIQEAQTAFIYFPQTPLEIQQIPPQPIQLQQSHLQPQILALPQQIQHQQMQPQQIKDQISAPPDQIPSQVGRPQKNREKVAPRNLASHKAREKKKAIKEKLLKSHIKKQKENEMLKQKLEWNQKNIVTLRLLLNTLIQTLNY